MCNWRLWGGRGLSDSQIETKYFTGLRSKVVVSTVEKDYTSSFIEALTTKRVSQQSLTSFVSLIRAIVRKLTIVESLERVTEFG